MSAGTVLAEGEKPSVQPAQAAPTASVAKSSAGEAPAWQKSAKPPVATNPAEPQGGDSDLIQVSGKVVETHEAGSYTYFLVEKDGKQTWVAVPPTKANIGDELSFRPGIKMVKFKSNILNREFDTIIFSVGTVGSKTDDKLLQKIADKNAKPAAAKGDAVMAAAAAPSGGDGADIGQGGRSCRRRWIFLLSSSKRTVKRAGLPLLPQGQGGRDGDVPARHGDEGFHQQGTQQDLRHHHLFRRTSPVPKSPRRTPKP